MPTTPWQSLEVKVEDREEAFEFVWRFHRVGGFSPAAPLLGREQAVKLVQRKLREVREESQAADLDAGGLVGLVTGRLGMLEVAESPDEPSPAALAAPAPSLESLTGLCARSLVSVPIVAVHAEGLAMSTPSAAPASGRPALRPHDWPAPVDVLGFDRFEPKDRLTRHPAVAVVERRSGRERLPFLWSFTAVCASDLAWSEAEHVTWTKRVLAGWRRAAARSRVEEAGVLVDLALGQKGILSIDTNEHGATSLLCDAPTKALLAEGCQTLLGGRVVDFARG